MEGIEKNQAADPRLLREQLEEAMKDLYFMRKHEGESPVYDRNIEHKRQQIIRLQRELEALEASNPHSAFPL